MDIKNARSRLATARTALHKADDILALCKNMDKYQPQFGLILLVQREIHQQVGRLNFMYETLRTVEAGASEDEE